MSALILGVVALLLISAAVSRYRVDRRAVAAGLVLACAGVLGASLSLPMASQSVPQWALVALSAADIVIIVACSIYAESRVRRAKV